MIEDMINLLIMKFRLMMFVMRTTKSIFEKLLINLSKINHFKSINQRKNLQSLQTQQLSISSFEEHR